MDACNFYPETCDLQRLLPSSSDLELKLFCARSPVSWLRPRTRSTWSFGQTPGWKKNLYLNHHFWFLCRRHFGLRIARVSLSVRKSFGGFAFSVLNLRALRMRKCLRRQMKMDITLSIRYQAKVNCTATVNHWISLGVIMNVLQFDLTSPEPSESVGVGTEIRRRMSKTATSAYPIISQNSTEWILKSLN